MSCDHKWVFYTPFRGEGYMCCANAGCGVRQDEWFKSEYGYYSGSTPEAPVERKPITYDQLDTIIKGISRDGMPKPKDNKPTHITSGAALLEAAGACDRFSFYDASKRWRGTPATPPTVLGAPGPVDPQGALFPTTTAADDTQILVHKGEFIEYESFNPNPYYGNCLGSYRAMYHCFITP